MHASLKILRTVSVRLTSLGKLGRGAAGQPWARVDADVHVLGGTL